MWDLQKLGWEARLKGQSEDAMARFDAARDLAQAHGFRFASAPQVARQPLGEIVDRMKAVRSREGQIKPRDAEAVLGLVAAPRLTVTGALAEFWRLSEERVHGKDANQLRIWKNQRKRAIGNFVEIIGDLALEDITRDHMLDFRQWWWERIRDEAMTANSANKDISALVNILRTVNEMKRLHIDLPVEKLAFTEGEQNTRLPFSDAWIRDRLLEPGALDGMNDQARAILLIMINTGCRPAEIAGLLPHHIQLGHEWPHISIEPEGRHLKTIHSRRKIPLLGVSLEAMKQHPEGFPRYRASGNLSGAVNKFLRENGLMETAEHSMYGLRHSFEDRLLAAGVDERIRADLMGHKLMRERYGAGAPLATSTAIIQQVAF
ncbi:tyrosine-type recombinase/integrase [Paracoccus sp. MBLB3053]|uniref:Tyrosine-type recombinase/integrase n=1 Tax=Paracoccus aurantius TaxID=3073814 RepID=A0ABU2HUA2_9RHOB|nr:tyrosine-type recombinase/integrase [Paracoccus sp. MBLB3053]MDS9468627.1 tyrosine-type recombinase/integrase [Paracoccus sp. MBLB3053]